MGGRFETRAVVRGAMLPAAKGLAVSQKNRSHVDLSLFAIQPVTGGE
jgi:hypothetical protein